MARHYTVPPDLQNKIASGLKTFGLRLEALADSAKLAESVKMLSDFFIENPDTATPWNEAWAQIAYLVYFLPLNHARAQAVVDQGLREGFFEGLNSVVDFGAGFGTASLALTEHFQNFTLIERAKDICSRFPFFSAEKNLRWLSAFESWSESKTADAKALNPKNSLVVFSYSLTELAELPAWARKAEALMLIEPSTQQDGRKLLALRQKLLAEGYSMWAPCPHQQGCPLFVQSKTDWCHDRIFFDPPAWFTSLEQHLPMKNSTLTMSYLLARKTAPPARPNNLGRTVGDHLKEKGKDRQLVCLNEERQFLAWMHKHGLEQEIPRGEKILLPEDSQKVSNEIRVRQKIEVL